MNVDALAAAWRDYFQRATHEQPRQPAARDYMAEDLRRTMARLIPEDASVLEVGCGTGELLAALPQRARTGVDMLPEVVEEARRRHPGVTFSVAEAPALDGLAAFDAVVCDRLVHSA